jgi:cytidylate kinase
MKDNIVTIDGPSASGKGTLARNIAKYLEFEILDSGLLYRVYAYLYEYGIEHAQITKTINQDITFKSDESGIIVLKEKKKYY